MNNRIFYHKRTGEPVQIIVHAQTKPNFQEVICYQELTKPFACYVMEKRQFFAEYVKEFTKLPLTGKVPIEKREDLPDKQPRISKGKIMEEETELLCEGDGAKELALKAFFLPQDTGHIVLHHVVSRKKQVIPALMTALQE